MAGVNGSSGRVRVEAQLVHQVRDGMQRRLATTGTMTKIGAVLLRPMYGVQRRMRRESLDMDNAADQERWQMLHNDLERYEIVSEKDSNTTRGNHCHVVYIEKGDDLPLVKSGADLRRKHKARIREDS